MGGGIPMKTNVLKNNASTGRFEFVTFVLRSGSLRSHSNVSHRCFQTWCGYETDIGKLHFLRHLSHSPGEVRVIGTLQNSNEFSETW